MERNYVLKNFHCRYLPIIQKPIQKAVMKMADKLQSQPGPQVERHMQLRPLSVNML